MAGTTAVKKKSLFWTWGKVCWAGFWSAIYLGVIVSAIYWAITTDFKLSEVSSQWKATYLFAGLFISLLYILLRINTLEP
jgi:hypothetical protein